MNKFVKYVSLEELKSFPTYAETQAYYKKFWARHGCNDPKLNYQVSCFDGCITSSRRGADQIPVIKISKSDQNK